MDAIKPDYNKTVTYGSGDDIIISPRLFARKEPNGFGYEVIDRLGGPNESKMFKSIYNTVDNDKANQAVICLREGKELPSTEGEVWPAVIIRLYEKHYDDFIVVHTKKEFHDVCIQIVKKRLQEKWYHAPEVVEPKFPGMNREDAEIMPKGPIQQEAFRLIDAYEKQMKAHNEYKKTWMHIQMAEQGSGPDALEVLKRRSNFEYERIEFINPKTKY